VRAEGGRVSSGWGAIYGGRLLADQIGEMTKGKLTYHFGRSLPSNDLKLGVTKRERQGDGSPRLSFWALKLDRTPKAPCKLGVRHRLQKVTRSHRHRYLRCHQH
jgi:hypothetical protein